MPTSSSYSRSSFTSSTREELALAFAEEAEEREEAAMVGGWARTDADIVAEAEEEDWLSSLSPEALAAHFLFPSLEAFVDHLSVAHAARLFNWPTVLRYVDAGCPLAEFHGPLLVPGVTLH